MEYRLSNNTKLYFAFANLFLLNHKRVARTVYFLKIKIQKEIHMTIICFDNLNNLNNLKR